MKKNSKKTPPPFTNKEDYIGGTTQKTSESDDSPSDTYGCARNLVDEHKNEEGEEYIETPPEENDSIKSKNSEGITEEDVIISLLAKYFSHKVIKSIMFNIGNYEKYILSVGYQNKKKTRQME